MKIVIRKSYIVSIFTDNICYKLLVNILTTSRKYGNSKLHFENWTLSWIQILFSFLLFSYFLSCSTPKKQEEKIEQKKETADIITLTNEQIKNANLVLGGFDKTMLSEDVKANGIVDVPPMNMASVSVLINGFVKSTKSLPGSFVRKGEVLAVINSMDYVQMQQDYLQTLSKLKFSTQELDRQTVLSQEDVGAKKKLQQADSEVSFAKAQVKGLEIKLQMIGNQINKLKNGQITSAFNVLSPIEGYIKSTNLAIGKNVAPTDILFEITGNAHKHLELKVFEKDITKINIGQQIIIENPKILNANLTATVFLVGKNVDAETKSINIHAHLNSEKTEDKLTVGQYVNTRILTGNRIAKTLPESAILRRDDGGFIFVQIKENTFQQIPIKLGLSVGGNVEVFLEKDINFSQIVKSGASILQAVLSGGEKE
jgi:cobalt-zinc-cadmium efflux system membrane fusion protein